MNRVVKADRPPNSPLCTGSYSEEEEIVMNKNLICESKPRTQGWLAIVLIKATTL